jgi:hypothetical protein
MERTNKANTSKHDQNSPPQPRNLKGKRSTPYTPIHNCKKPYTGTEVMAQKSKSKTKNL